MSVKTRRLPAATADAAEIRRHTLSAMIAHKRRCKLAGPPAPEDISRMIDAFHAAGRAVIACPPAYALPVQNGAGR